jgi:hypothetical protein
MFKIFIKTATECHYLNCKQTTIAEIHLPFQGHVLCPCGSLCHQRYIHSVLFSPNRPAENIINMNGNRLRYNLGVLAVEPFVFIFMPIETDIDRAQSFVRGMFTYTASIVSTALKSEWQTRNVKLNNLMKSRVEIRMEEKWMHVILRKIKTSVSKSRKSI